MAKSLLLLLVALVTAQADDFRCIISALHRSSCLTAQDSEGEACMWCHDTVDDGKGVCLSPEQAEKAMSMSQGEVTCDSSDEVVTLNPQDWKCSMEAMSDPTKCASTTDENDAPCDYCTYNYEGRDFGFCMSPSQAQTAMSILGQELHCSNSVISSPHLRAAANKLDCDEKYKCTKEGYDSDACSKAKTVDDEDCEWCACPFDPKYGLCLSPEQSTCMEKIFHKVHCDASHPPELPQPSYVHALPFDEFQCTAEGFMDPDACEKAGSSCSFCKYGNNGLCVSSVQAQALENFSNEISCTPTTTEKVEIDFSSLKCSMIAFMDKNKCETSYDANGHTCEYCELSDKRDMGLCVSQEQAQELLQYSDQITCSAQKAEKLPFEPETRYEEFLYPLAESIEYYDDDEELLKPEIIYEEFLVPLAESIEYYDDDEEEDFDVQGIHFSDFKCTLSAFTNQDKCRMSESAEGESCYYCKMEENGEEAGLCVSPEQGERMQEMSPEVSCVTGAEDEELVWQEEVANPVVACNLGGVDFQTCLDETKVNAKCIWCDAEIGGFCFPEGWKDWAGELLKCTSDPNDPPETEDSSSMDINDWSFFDTSCLKATDSDTCSSLSDDKSGEGCLWCDAAGVFGVCLSPEDASKVNNYMTCDSNSDNFEGVLMKFWDGDFSDTSFITSSCLKNGLTGTDFKSCTSAVDNNTGEPCVYCKADRFGVGLCMPPSFKGKETKWYSCVGYEEWSAEDIKFDMNKADDDGELVDAE